MLRGIWLACLIAPLVLSPHTPADGASLSRPSSRTSCPAVHRRLAAGAARPITVHVTVGHVELEARDGSAIDIRVESQAPSRADCHRITATISDDDEVTVRAEQRDGGRSPLLTTVVRIEAPPQYAARVAVFEGHVAVDRWSGGVSVAVERGSIAATDVAGQLRLETTIGDIRASIAAGGLGPTRLRTFNGHVTLRFSEPPLNLRLLALSLGGRIESTLPVTMRSGFGPRFAETTRGTGGPVVSIDVVDGTIAIESAP